MPKLSIEKMTKFQKSFRQFLRAGYPALTIRSWEEPRVQGEIVGVTQSFEKPYNVVYWSINRGIDRVLVNSDSGETSLDNLKDFQEPTMLVNYLAEGLANDELARTVIILRDFHMISMESNPNINRGIRELFPALKRVNAVLVFLGPVTVAPREWEKSIHPVPYSLPDRISLREILDQIIESAIASGAKDLKIDDALKDKAVEAALGLTADEAENAFSLSIVKEKNIVPAIIHEAKAKTLAKSSLVEVDDTRINLEEIAGLEFIKEYITNRKKGFGKDANKAGVPIPAGVVIVGVPGSGKTLIARAFATEFDLPLLNVNASKLKGGLVGKTEENTETVIEILKACAPCVVFMDEVEKMFAGAGGRALDGGASEGQFGQFLTFLNDRVAQQIPVFFVCTANNVALLPPEFQRAGRFDAVFGVGLPSKKAREEAFKIHIAKKRTSLSEKRDPKKYNTEKLAKMTDGYTPAEIEQIVVRALTNAFSLGEELSNNHLEAAVNRVKPLSKTRPVEIRNILQFLKDGGGEPASIQDTEEKSVSRKMELELDKELTPDVKPEKKKSQFDLDN